MRTTHIPFRIAVAITVVGSLVVWRAQSGSTAKLSAKADGASRRAGFTDEFNGTRLDDSRWNRCHWWGPNGCTIGSNNELQWYTPQQVTQRNGTLRLTAMDSPVTGSDGKRYRYRSAMVTTGPSDGDGSPAKFAFRYGRVEARATVPSGQGLWPALWLLPATTRSRPEIDIFEVRGSETNRLSMHLHTDDEDGEARSVGEKWTGPDLSKGWHTYALDWQPGSLRWEIDGKEAWTIVGDEVPSEPMYLVANLAVGGDWPGPPTAKTRFPASLVFDYIRVTEQPG